MNQDALARGYRVTAEMPPSHPGVLTTLNVSTEFLKSEVASSCNSVTELFLRNTIHHLPFTIYHLPFTIHHLPFIIHHLSFTIYHSPFLSTPAWRRYGISPFSSPAPLGEGNARVASKGRGIGNARVASKGRGLARTLRESLRVTSPAQICLCYNQNDTNIPIAM